MARMGDWKVTYSVLVEKTEGKRPLGRPRRRWEDNMLRYLQKVGRRGRDWTTLVADAYECGDRHSGFIKCQEFLG